MRSSIEADKLNHINGKKKELEAMRAMVDQAFDSLAGDGDFLDFGRLLHESWLLEEEPFRKGLEPVHRDDIQDGPEERGPWRQDPRAGGGGFILFFVNPECAHKVKRALDFLLHVPFRFDVLGSQIIYYSEQSV